MSTTQDTAGMVPVTEAQFFAYVGPRDVHPRATREASIWETPQRVVVGRTTPGYVGQGPRTYALSKAAFAALSK